jgi:hypothetical protein
MNTKRRDRAQGMSMQKEVSAKIVAVAREYSASLREILDRLRVECSEEEFLRYERGIRQVLGHIEEDVMAPIVAEHPDLAS